MVAYNYPCDELKTFCLTQQTTQFWLGETACMNTKKQILDENFDPMDHFEDNFGQNFGQKRGSEVETN